jgi:hypothetical protein
MGCHQQAGSNRDEAWVLAQGTNFLTRTNFPTDYVWSYANGGQNWALQLQPAKKKKKLGFWKALFR